MNTFDSSNSMTTKSMTTKSMTTKSMTTKEKEAYDLGYKQGKENTIKRVSVLKKEENPRIIKQCKLLPLTYPYFEIANKPEELMELLKNAPVILEELSCSPQEYEKVIGVVLNNTKDHPMIIKDDFICGDVLVWWDKSEFIWTNSECQIDNVNKIDNDFGYITITNITAVYMQKI